MACPNINSQQWKELVAKIGTFEAMKEFIKNGEKIPDASLYQETFKGVNATMKIVNALQKIPRSSYPSNSVQGFYNDLIKQGAPKNQIELLKQHITANNITDINTNELITSLLAEMSYTVEIYFNKPEHIVHSNPNEPIYISAPDGSEFIKHLRGENIVITEAEYKKGKKEIEEKILNSSTQYYSNLTVPGGTNYTENEIATPAIIPSIKGHAQFATDNGIGWFRSDDKHPFTGFLEDLIASGTIKKVPCG